MVFPLRPIVLSAVLAVPTLALLATSASASGIDRVLASHGLLRTECSPGVVEIRMSLEKSVCAIPTATYPAGAYYFNEAGYTITPAATARPATTPLPVQPTQPTTVIIQTTTPGGYLPGGMVQPAVPGPAILNVSSPDYPVSDALVAQIGASLASRGLTPAACNVNPGVTIVVGGYLACAYPTPQYPAGRYALQ